MSFDTAKKAIDYVLNNKEFLNSEGVIWDFIGGEPFLEIKLIDKITDYIKLKMYILNHPWFSNYRLSFSTNGMLYKNEDVQNYITKNKKHLSLGISIDGNKIKHDLQRIKRDGTGSYDEVVENAKLWLKQFPEASTKATFAREDLKYLKDSIISLWELGIKTVSANIVFEDVWEEKDEYIFEKQLKDLADYILGNKLWDKYTVRFFDPKIGFPLQKNSMKWNYCGTGEMLAIDCDGNFYPCIRFLDFSLENFKGRQIGSIDTGIDINKLRPFQVLNLQNQSKEECINCNVASGCSFCTAFNYDNSKEGTIYNRATYNCNMHKANVRACEYFWSEYTKLTGKESPRDIERKHINSINNTNKYLLFIMADNIKPHCNYESNKNSNVIMSKEIYEEGIKFAVKNNFIPVILNSIEEKEFNYNEYLNFTNVDNINRSTNNSLIILDNIKLNYQDEIKNRNIIILVKKINIVDLSNNIIELYGKVNRINIVIQDLEDWTSTELEFYKNELNLIYEFIKQIYDTSAFTEIDILTDRMYLDDTRNCTAGENLYALAPNGKFYNCPAFYFENSLNYIGDLMEDNDFIKKVCDKKSSPVCKACDAYHCKGCKFLNKKLTNEINIPSKIQCEKSHIERAFSYKLQKYLVNQKQMIFASIIKEVDYIDPLEEILKVKKSK